jgi:hypothetical protein
MPTDAGRDDALGPIAAAISRRRPGEDAAAMARALLRYESGTRTLVGLTADASTALFCDGEAGTLTAVRVEERGVTATSEILSWGVHDAGAWVDLYGDHVDWIRPRYDA